MANNADTTGNRPVLLLTRPAVSSAKFATRLNVSVVSHADLIISPVLDIVPKHAEVDLTGCAGVIFSSVNGVIHGPDNSNLPAHCVGQETAKAAAAKGWRIANTALNADELINKMSAAHSLGSHVHISGEEQRGDIAARLTGLGVPTERVVVYVQEKRALSSEAIGAIAGERRVVLPLFSPRSAAYFAEQVKDIQKVNAIALSQAVADALSGVALDHLHVLAQPIGTQMVHAVELLLSQDSLP